MSSRFSSQLSPSRLWSFFYELNQIPRPTGHMEAISKYIIDFAKKADLPYKQDRIGNILITKQASKGLEDKDIVILQSHLDMVPQKNMDITHDFLKDPIEMIVEGNVVKANGTTLGADNGIGVATMLAILEDETLKHPPLECLFTVDEEVGMIGAFGIEAGFLKGKILLNLDTEDEGELTIGCAGGADINATFEYQNVKSDDLDECYRVSISALQGGHSGTDINKGRANAIKLISYLIKDAILECDVRLVDIQGGSMRNAIPREAVCTISILPANRQLLFDLISDFQNRYKEEYRYTDPQLKISIDAINKVEEVLPMEIQDCIINALVGVPNGVVNNLASFPDVVETSTNLATVKTEKGRISVGFLTRSSSDDRKDEICSSIESVFVLAGARVEIVNPYPGWQPNPNSVVADKMKKIYKQLFDKDAHIVIVHAGLECGIILDSTPNLDIVSFGPNIFNPHSPSEYVEIDSVSRFYEFLTSTLENL